MATEEDYELVGDRVKQSGDGDGRRDDDERPVTSVLVDAPGPRHARTVERGFKHVVQRPVDVQPNVIIATGITEAGDVNREQAAHLAIEREGPRSAPRVTR